ncbi:uncharacterized protein LOC143253860 [Tachypleus tridentatus]|uniref:uncharacterized protein LOC143253860 n=1 Tax=Tachypleus tridentatus TaxID=6853 RepID=UPI003FCF5D2C
MSVNGVLLVIVKFICLLRFGVSKSGSWTIKWEDLRKESEELFSCEKESTNVCFSPNNNDENPTMMNSTAFSQRACFCDNDCFDYGDCCIDIAGMRPYSDVHWVCRSLFGDWLSFYVVATCTSQWTSSIVRSFCERDPSELEDGDFYTYIRQLPVYSNRTSILYANIFCALCNNDPHVQYWDLVVSCVGHNNNSGSQVSAHELLKSEYSPQTTSWKVTKENETLFCQANVSLQSLSHYYPIRRCKQSISNCSPNWHNEATKQRCAFYTSYVHNVDRHNNLLGTYRNIHCAKCNNISSKDLSCSFPTSSGRMNDWLDIHTHPSLVLLLEIGVGKQSCGRKGVYVDIGQGPECLLVSCGKFYVQKGYICTPTNDSEYINQTGIRKDCLKVQLEDHKFVVLSNNSIYVKSSDKVFKPGEYEVSHEVNGTVKHILVCLEEFIVKFSPLQNIISVVTLCFSITCLTAHLMVFLIVSQLRNLPGKVLISLSTSLLLADCSFLAGNYSQGTGLLCQILGITTHFLYLAAFFWMNVMAVDTFQTFRTCRQKLHDQKHLFQKYALYSWFSPALVVILSVLVDNFVTDNPYQPAYGQFWCWFSKKKALLVFFALPVGLIVSVNFLLFILTAKSLNKTMKQTKRVTKLSDKVRFLLYVKLVLALGITWTFGFIAAFSGISVLWYPFIVLKGLQGALIFIAFTCKKRIFLLFRQNIKCLSKTYPRQRWPTVQTTLASTSFSVTALVLRKRIQDLVLSNEENNR